MGLCVVQDVSGVFVPVSPQPASASGCTGWMMLTPAEFGWTNQTPDPVQFGEFFSYGLAAVLASYWFGVAVGRVLFVIRGARH